MERSPFVISATSPEGRHLLLNTSTGRFASLGDDAYQQFKDAEGPFAQQLFESGFLCESAQAEIDAQHFIFQMQREDTSTLKLSIAPTYACNCRCAYCYESDKKTSWKFMSEEVEQAVYRFVKDRYDADGFSTLSVEWYGGDPSLCLDIVERMANNLRTFCAQHDLSYTSTMLSNCTRVGEGEAKLIARAGVEMVLVTIDGPEEQHNLRRPTVEDINAYAAIKSALRFLTQEGVACSVVCNSDKVNLPLIPELQKDLAELGVTVSPTKLNDYGHFFGTGRFCKPNFDLFTHQEFHHACHDLMKDQGMLNQITLKGMLSASCNFCNGQKNNYFIIDNVGDVYKCDGRMGDKYFCLFNVMDDQPVLDQVVYDPCNDEECATCPYLPLCWGNCRWEREACGMPCHPLKTCRADYLSDYAACFPEPTEPVALLA